eukprot:TRINITY_DN46766_c0_g1_i1.p1 TRINITY_DN46766_c0_g1~~TRINITY_DN46766_c0_g1_i1.p1  ORF type:complete len:321 (+),score=86.86 TRINITY_DN46766_c0_g1_i1:120-1082(+)
MVELPRHKSSVQKGSGCSMLYNNLSVVDDLGVYVSGKTGATVFQLSSASPQVRHPREPGPGEFVHQAKLCRFGSALMLVVVWTSRVEFWNVEGDSALTRSCTYVHKDEQELFLSRGIGVLQGKGDDGMVAVGHSNGSVSVLDVQGTVASLAKLLERHSECVSDVAAGDCDGVALIATADPTEIVLRSDDLGECASASFPSDVITSLQFCPAHLAAAFGSGAIKLLSPKTLSVYCDIAAHSRWINAIAVSPDGGMLASVGNDTVLLVWRLPDRDSGSKVELCGQHVVASSLLTGVQWADDGKRVCLNAYDWDSVHFFDAQC